MTTPARIQEADDASVAFQIALSYLGVKTIEDAIGLWADVPPDARATLVAKWLDKAVFLVMSRRKRSRELALAYYRLARALRTGKTIADPYHPIPKTVPLSELRREFGKLITPSTADTGEIPFAEPGALPADPVPVSTSQPAYDPADYHDDEDVPVDTIPRLAPDLDSIETAAEQEARIDLMQLGPNNLTRKTGVIDTSQPGTTVDAARQTAHKDAGNRQAATAGRIVMNGARGPLHYTTSRDKVAIGWIRLSRTGTPCGWCAMLISRGPVYKSSASAQFGEDMDLYHDNCHCYAEAVYSVEQYNDSPRYALNRRYAVLWPIVTKGLSGKAALSAWRDFIRREQQGAQAAA